MTNLKRTNDLIILKSRNFKLQSETYVQQIWTREMVQSTKQVYNNLKATNDVIIERSRYHS